MSVGPLGMIPALLMRTSRRPNSLETFSVAAVMESWSVTSRGIKEKVAWGFWLWRSERAFSPFSRVRLVMITWYSGDEAARSSAVKYPMPPLLPKVK